MEVVLVLVVLAGLLYLLSVLLSWGMIMLIYDEITPKFALVPVLNLMVPFVDARRTRGVRRHGSANATTHQELDIAHITQMPVVPGLNGPMFPPVRQREDVDPPRR